MADTPGEVFRSRMWMCHFVGNGCLERRVATVRPMPDAPPVMSAIFGRWEGIVVDVVEEEGCWVGFSHVMMEWIL